MSRKISWLPTGPARARGPSGVWVTDFRREVFDSPRTRAVTDGKSPWGGWAQVPRCAAARIARNPGAGSGPRRSVAPGRDSFRTFGSTSADSPRRDSRGLCRSRSARAHRAATGSSRARALRGRCALRCRRRAPSRRARGRIAQAAGAARASQHGPRPPPSAADITTDTSGQTQGEAIPSAPAAAASGTDVRSSVTET